MGFILETIRLGFANLMLHKLRSLLTMLGIICGVAAVIIMIAVTEGNKQAALEQIRQLGVHNVIVRSTPPVERTAASQSSSSERVRRYGLTDLDLRRIQETAASAEHVIPLCRVASLVSRGAIRVPQVEVFGTRPELKDVTSMRLVRGRYLTADDLHHRERHDDRARHSRAQRHRHHQPEGDGGQGHRQQKTNDIVAHRRMRHLDLAMTVRSVRVGAHRSTPIR